MTMRRLLAARDVLLFAGAFAAVLLRLIVETPRKPTNL